MLRLEETVRLRAALEATLVHTCTITRPSSTQTPAGRPGGADPDDVASGVPCRLEPVSERRRESLVADGPMAPTAYLLTLAYDAIAVQAKDTIVVGGDRYEAETPSITGSLALATVVRVVRTDG